MENAKIVIDILVVLHIYGQHLVSFEFFVVTIELLFFTRFSKLLIKCAASYTCFSMLFLKVNYT